VKTCWPVYLKQLPWPKQPLEAACATEYSKLQIMYPVWKRSSDYMAEFQKCLISDCLCWSHPCASFRSFIAVFDVGRCRWATQHLNTQLTGKITWAMTTGTAHLESTGYEKRWFCLRISLRRPSILTTMLSIWRILIFVAHWIHVHGYSAYRGDSIHLPSLCTREFYIEGLIWTQYRYRRRTV
jgi:hypothetical protein